MVSGMLKNNDNLFPLKDEMISITKPIKENILLERRIGTISQLKTVIKSSPLHFKFGFKFYNYYDVIFEYEDEKLVWKAFSCKKNEEAITNNINYNPRESLQIVSDIEELLKSKIPQQYLKEMNGKNYESFEKRFDFITVNTKQEYNELKREENNDDFKTTDECLDFMIEEVKKTFGSNAENFKIIDNYNYQGWHINFTFEAYKSFTVKIIHELEDGAQIVIGSDEQIRNGNMEHWFNIPMSANDFGRKTAKEFLAQLKQNLELRIN